MAADKARESIGNIRLNVDCEEALTGLKAVQREAKEATKALRELEDAEKNAQNAYKALGYEDAVKERDFYRDGVYAALNRERALGASEYVASQINDLSRFSTKEIADELAKREGVEEYAVDPMGTGELSLLNEHEGEMIQIKGPAKITVNRD